MQNVGYIIREKVRALDDAGHEECILALRLHGERFGIRVQEIRGLLEEGVPARVERVRRNWRIFLDGVEGTASLSQSGKAVNLEFVTGGRYTVARKSLQALLTGDAAFAMIAEIPGGPQTLVPLRRPHHQRHLPGRAGEIQLLRQLHRPRHAGHGAHHRGELGQYLATLDKAPGDLDFIIYVSKVKH